MNWKFEISETLQVHVIQIMVSNKNKSCPVDVKRCDGGSGGQSPPEAEENLKYLFMKM